MQDLLMVVLTVVFFAVALLITVATLIYLVVTLLFPEKF